MQKCAELQPKKSAKKFMNRLDFPEAQVQISIILGLATTLNALLAIPMENKLTYPPSVIVCRVSSDDQRDGFSLAAQQEICEQYAKREGLFIEKIFQFSESARGQKKRAEFYAIINYLEKENIQHLIVEKMDRLLRNLPDYGLAEQIVESGVTIHLVREGKLHKDSTAHERLVFGFKALLAKSYSDNLSEEIKKGTRKKIEQGIPLRQLYGYRQKEKKVIVIKKEAKNIRRIYKEYLGGLNIIEIADLLNREGIPAPRGPKWNNQTVHRILTRPDYIGEYVFKGRQYKGDYEKIIKPADFYAVQKKISSGNRKTDQSRWPLNGLVKFENGRALSGQVVRGHYYYGGFIDTKKKMRRYVRQDLLMDQIEEAISATKWPERFSKHVLDFAKLCCENETKNLDQRLEKARYKKKKLRKKIQRLTGIYLEGEIPRPEYLARKHDFEKEYENAQGELNVEHRDHKKFINKIGDIAHVFHQLPKIYAAACFKDKVRILKAYISKVIVSTDKHLLRLEYKEPFASFLIPEILSISGSTSPANMETSGIEPPTSTMPL